MNVTQRLDFFPGRLENFVTVLVLGLALASGFGLTTFATEPIEVDPEGMRSDPIEVDPDGLRNEPIEIDPEGLRLG